MHETAIAYEIMRQVSQICRNAGTSRATRIEIEIGKGSGIDGNLLRETLRLAYSRLLPGHNTEIDLIEIPVQAHCQDCGATFTPWTLFASCPVCDNYRYEIDQGNELKLRAVWIEQSDYTE